MYVSFQQNLLISNQADVDLNVTAEGLSDMSFANIKIVKIYGTPKVI